MQEYRKRNRDHLNELNRNWYQANLDGQRAYKRRQQKEYKRSVRYAVLSAYGGQCECCQESREEFLSIDHIYGGGGEHRKIVGYGSVFYQWLKNEGFPPGYRILCYNCHYAITHRGYCPHAIQGSGNYNAELQES